MKICILGPVETPSCFGGVAIFDKGLARALTLEGCEVFLATDQKDAIDAYESDIRTYVFGNKIKFSKIIARENPDYIITQLAYAKYLLELKTKAKKIYFLHGFFNRNHYGTLKSMIASAYQKLLIKNCDMVFSNSYFTEMINNNFFGIKTDAVFHIGVTDRYMETIVKNSNVMKKNNTVFFAGRLESVKGVDKLIEATKYIKDSGVDIRVTIAGDGPERDELKNMAEKYGLNINFLGRITQDEIALHYLESEVFVSLNESEPYGIVFPEALLANCKIVCPYTGGQIEYLNKHTESVCYINRKSARSIADGIIKMFEFGETPNLTKEERESYTYKNAAKGIIEYVSEWRKNNG